jgi:lipoate-protein ligase A
MTGENNDECGMMNDECHRSSPAAAVRYSSIINHQSSFSLLLDPPAAGAWNMAVDETLLELAAAEGQCALRFYQWAEPTLSLGYFQAYADREQHAASRHCAVVRRTSGGGAIMHDFDVTYSLAVPERHPLAADRLRTYRVVHEALVAVLADLGIKASLFTGGASMSDVGCGSEDGDGGGCPLNPHGAKRVASTTSSVPFNSQPPFLCFQRRSPGDVLVGGEKVAGSAQRRRLGAVLQHGSVLLARSPAAPELPGLKELVGATILVEEFIQAWLERLAKALGVTPCRGELSEEHRRRAARLAAEKYGSPNWTNAR